MRTFAGQAFRLNTIASGSGRGYLIEARALRRVRETLAGRQPPPQKPTRTALYFREYRKRRRAVLQAWERDADGRWGRLGSRLITSS